MKLKFDPLPLNDPRDGKIPSTSIKINVGIGECLAKCLNIDKCRRKRVSSAWEDTQVEKWNTLFIYVGIVTGLFAFAKGLWYGMLSSIALFGNVAYFGFLTYVALKDGRGDWSSRFVVNVSGLLLTLSQLFGMFILNTFTWESDSW
jgi:hypothetical protein